MDEEKILWEKWNQFIPRPLRADRIPLLHMVVFEQSLRDMGEPNVRVYSRLGLSLNVSNGGLCILLQDSPFSVGEILRVNMPLSIVGVRTPTLADVRWIHGVPFQPSSVSVMGLKFCL
jgi:hypothetical protein